MNRLYAVVLASVLSWPMLAESAPPPATADQLAAGESLKGWGKATWGQGEEEVLASYDGKLDRRQEDIYRLQGTNAVPTGEKRSTLRLEPFEIAGTPMAVVFYFHKTSQKLQHVGISPIVKPDANEKYLYHKICDALEVLLTVKYGAPTTSQEDKGGSRNKVWNFRNTRLRIDYVRFLGAEISCALDYKPTAVTAADLNKL